MPGLKQAILSQRRTPLPIIAHNVEAMVHECRIDIAQIQSGMAALNDRLDVAIVNTIDRTTISFSASQQAINKAEDAQKAYNSSHNDLARRMEDQYGHMLPRAEAVAILERMREDIKELRDQQHAAGGQSKGMRDMWGWVFGASMALVTIGLGFITILSK